MISDLSCWQTNIRVSYLCTRRIVRLVQMDPGKVA